MALKKVGGRITVTEDVAPIPNARGYWFPMLDRALHDSRTLAGLETAEERGLLNPGIAIGESDDDTNDLLPDFVSPDDDDHLGDMDELPSPNVECEEPNEGGEGTSSAEPASVSNEDPPVLRSAPSSSSSAQDVPDPAPVAHDEGAQAADEDAAIAQQRRMIAGVGRSIHSG